MVMVMGDDEKLTSTAKGKEIIAADADNETLDKASKLDEINPSGDSKACIFCHMETDHGKELCPLRDVSKKNYITQMLFV
ncbi:hypothetical protein AQUCO_00500033v1 [Aquilegia coerulea]|uniref:Uncharacterized protein n=1 Tax=Aquilegia coerulea TaxID=218851 RepID=A0A2G5EQ03_AQUCA|nr:hypothetical protein AQUCO_00500033v1 [Aquilegia coerulea]